MATADWTKPSLSSTWANFILEIHAKEVEAAIQFSNSTGDASTPVGAIKWDSGAKTWKVWDGTNFSTNLASSNTFGINVNGSAAGIRSGTVNQTLYQTGVNTTGFIPNNTTGTVQFLSQVLGNKPAYVSLVNSNIPNALTGKTYNGISLGSNTPNVVYISNGTSALAIHKNLALNGMSGKTLHINNSLTLSGVDGSNINIGTGGTLSSGAYVDESLYALKNGSRNFTGNIHVVGGITATGDITGFNASDINLKTNIKQIENPLNKVLTLSAVKYNWNNISNLDTNVVEVGLIAQEVEKVLPEVVIRRDNGYLAINYVRLIPLLVGAIKELNQKLEEVGK